MAGAVARIVVVWWSLLRVGRAEEHELRRQQNEVLEGLAAQRRALGACNMSFGRRDRLGICVTGQLWRLETESKLRHLIEPASRRYAVDVALVTAREPPTFVNKETVGGRTNASDLNRFGAAGSLVFDDRPQEVSPYVVREYAALSDKPQLGDDRARAHARQWKALFECYGHFAKLEGDRCAAGDPSRYAAFVRLRDDALVFRDFVVEPLNGSVVVPDCQNFSGYNDKVAIVHADVARVFFTQPIVDYLFNYSSLGVTHGNPEHLLRRVLDKHDVPVVKANVDRIPVYTSRVDPETNATCVLFYKLKLGKYPRCWPASCRDRQALYCAHCRLRFSRVLKDEFFRPDPDDPERHPSCDDRPCPS